MGVIPFGKPRLWPAGTAWSPTVGLSAPGLICGRNARPACGGSVTPAHPSLIHDRLVGNGVRPALPAPVRAPRRRALRGRPDGSRVRRDGAEQVPHPSRRRPPVPHRSRRTTGVRTATSPFEYPPVMVAAIEADRRRDVPVDDRAAHVVAARRRPGDRGHRRVGVGTARRDRLPGARPSRSSSTHSSTSGSICCRSSLPSSPSRSSAGDIRYAGGRGARRRVLRQALAARAGAHAHRAARLAGARGVRRRRSWSG